MVTLWSDWIKFFNNKLIRKIQISFRYKWKKILYHLIWNEVLSVNNETIGYQTAYCLERKIEEYEKKGRKKKLYEQ